MSAFGFDEDLVSVLVGKAVNLVFDAGAVSWSFSGDGTRKQGAIGEAGAKGVVDSGVGVGDVAGQLGLVVRGFEVAEGLSGVVAVLGFALAVVNASAVDSGRRARFHSSCNQSSGAELVCNAFCSPFSRSSPLKLLLAEVNSSLKERA